MVCKIISRPPQEQHPAAELERLRAGFDGCGCSECQEYYKTIDLSNYGKRVIHLGSIITITDGRAGADLWDKYHIPDPPPFTTEKPPDAQEVVSKPSAGGILPPLDIQAQNIETIKRPVGRPRKDEGGSRATRWRRKKEAMQGVLL